MKNTVVSDENNEQSLQSIIANLQQALLEKDKLIENLTHQLQLAKHLRFARKTEKYNPNQLSLFDEAELPTEPEDATAECDTEITVKEHVRVRKGRKPLPKNLPRIEVTHDITAEDKSCSCGCELTEIGDDRSEQLEIIPQLAYVVVNIKKKYACKRCELTIKTAKLPKQPIPKSIATAGTLAYVIDSKFNYHLPLYRLEQILNRNSVEITRATLGEWVIKSADLLRPLVKLLHDIILKYDVAFADETTVQVLKEPGRAASQKSRMWLFIGGTTEKRSFVYQYYPTREGLVAERFFEDFSGYLHTDCYGGYDIVFADKKVQAVACWAHARRYFYDIVKTTKKKKGLAHFAVSHIAKLYKIESDAKEAEFDSKQLHEIRQLKSKPLLDEFKTWLDTNSLLVPSQTPISKAIFYCLNNWKKLMGYMEDGRLEIDNNRAERAIKPFVIGRKNWLFHGNQAGADAAAILYSLMETCKEHQVEPYAYFKYALSEIVNCETVEELERLLPFNCDPVILATQRVVPDLVWPGK